MSKKKISCLLIVICAIQLSLSLFWASKKSYLFMDEVFSYATSNRAEGTEAELPANEWLDESWFVDYVSADPEHTFEYSIPYNNQETDVHPPLFYLFLHTACSFIPGEFSYWAGMGCNIVFFIGSSIVLYFLGKELFGNKSCGLLPAFLFGISYGGLNTMAFIRMYMLLALIVLLHTYVCIRYMEREETPLKGYVFLGLTLIAGVLTQYYFVIIAFFFGVWYVVKFLMEKQYKKLGSYILTIFVSAGCSLLIYPTMVKHVFGTGRGMEARENFALSEGYLEKLITMWRLMDSQLFFNLFALVLLLFFILLFLHLKHQDKINKKTVAKAGVILFACAGYFMVVTKVAPYQIDRYLMPIYPLVYLLVIGSIYQLFAKLLPAKTAVVLCTLIFGGLSVTHMIYSAIPHTYSQDIVITPRLTTAEENQECYAIYIGSRKEDIPKYYDILQVLSRYRGYYYIDELDNADKVREDMQLLKEEKKIILYVDANVDAEEASHYLKEILPGTLWEEEHLLSRDESWDVYCWECE